MRRRILFFLLFFLVFILLGSISAGKAHAAIYCGCDPCTCCTGDNCTAAPLACGDVTKCDPGPYGLICTTERICTGGVVPKDCPDWFATCCNPCNQTNPTGVPDEPTSAPGEPTSRPTRIPTGATTPGDPYCGDGLCGGGLETCASCPEDCGAPHCV